MLGIGQDLYEVHGGAPSRKLSFTKTNGVVELLPGDYKVGLHRVFQPIVVRPGKQTEVKAGTLLVKGPPKILYSVFDPTISLVLSAIVFRRLAISRRLWNMT